MHIKTPSPRKYFLLVVFPLSYDPESFAGDTVTSGMIYHVKQAIGDDPDKRDLCLPDWGLGAELKTTHPLKA
jgi:hypothetical protein